MTGIKFGDKGFRYYWPLIRIPFFILVGWNILALLVGKLSIDWYRAIFTTWSGILLQVAAFAFVGYYAVADCQAEVRHAVWAGAILGTAIGFIGAMIAMVMFYFMPEIIEFYVRQAIAKGAPEQAVRTMLRIGKYIGFITGPIQCGILGAVIAWISGVITKKVCDRKQSSK